MTELIRPAETVQGMEDALRHKTPPSVELTLDLSAPEDTVLFDASQLQTVLSNLVAVAAEQLRGPGKLKLSVDVEVLQDHVVGPVMLSGDHVVIAVQVEGEGGLADASASGTDKRLASVQGIVDKSGGYVEVLTDESAPRMAWRVILPLASAQEG